MEHTAIPETATTAPAPTPVPIKIQPGDLPLSCPRPGETLWNMHPRVYLPIEDTPEGRILCPYCGAIYELEGEVKRAH